MIEVELPDGSIAEFPEGTPPEVIQQALQDKFPAAPTEAPITTAQEVAPTGASPKEGSQRYFSGLFTAPSEEDQRLLDATLPMPAEKTPLTPTTVLEDKDAMDSIRKYMVRFQGLSADTSDEEMVDDFLAHSRKFAAGQSVVTLGELYSLQKSDEEGLAIAAGAYDTFDRFSGVFSEDYTWGEMFEGLGSYARAVIIDPTNLLGVGVGRLVTGGSAKAGTVALKSVAKAAGENAAKKALVKKLGAKGAKGVLEKQALGTAIKLPAEKAAVGAATQAAKLAEREVLRKAATTATVSTALKKQALKETAIATGVDSVTAVGIDTAYQEGMILTGRQEEYDQFQSGLAALGGVVGGGLAFATARKASTIAKKSEGIISAFQKYDPIEAPAQAAAKQLSEGDTFMKSLEKNFTEFSVRVASGRKLTEEGDLIRGVNEQEFFRMFLLGNDELGVKGLAHNMQELGVQLPARPRYEGDNVTSFMADALQRLPKKEMNQFEEMFRKNVGAHLPNYKDASMKDIANLMSYQTSVSGQQLQIFSQVKKILGVTIGGEGGEISDATVEQAVSAMNPAVGKNLSFSQFQKAAKDLKDNPRPVSYFQNLLVQTIVSHPGTTMANIIGSVYRGALDTVADFAEAALYTGIGMRGFVTGNMDDLRKGVSLGKAAIRRPFQLVPSNATMKEAEDYIALRPHVEDVLFRFRSGGVENSDVFKAFNMDKTSKITQTIGKAVEAYKNFAQKVYLTDTQDRVFKNLNIMYYLDKNIELEFGMSYNKFMKQPNAAELMQTDRYLAREFKAVDETLSSVFAKSYSSRDTLTENPIHWVATAIEDVRKFPVLGAAIPFGQFFNNTVDLMADYTGAKLLYRAVGFGEGRSKEAIVESMAKGATGWAAIWSMSTTEMNYIDQGLATFEARDTDGQIYTKQYDFPESFFKGVARVVAHMRMGQEVPEDLTTNLTQTFGPENLTRSAGQGWEKFKEYFGETFDGGVIDGAKTITEALGSLGGSTWVSGFTRPLDPLNQMAGFFKEEGATVLDRRQGFRALNESARYIDQFPGVSEGLMALGSEERNTASRREPVGEVGKIFGYRTIPEQSYTQRMMNGIERPDWQSGFAGLKSTGSAKLDNKLNGLIFDHVEPLAARLLLGTRWKESSLEAKKKAVDAIWEQARNSARRSLVGSPVVEDSKLAMADRVIKAAGSQKSLKRAMDSLGLSGDITEYDAHQMQAILTELSVLKREDALAPYKQ